MGLITLLTDFGTADSYVAELKGVLLSSAPNTALVDVTHAIAPGDVRAGAYLLGRAWHRFPRGTVHLAVVDPGVGTDRAALALTAHGHYFVGPDNGLFTFVLRDSEVQIVLLPTPDGASATFHGRDLFAPAAAALAGGATLAKLGDAFTAMPARLVYAEPHYEGKSVVGEVVYVDRFGSLVTNLTPELVHRRRRE
jgi:S-adenosylmethionine hydrolase